MERLFGRGFAAIAGRVFLRTGDHEEVLHEGCAPDDDPVVDERLLGRRGVGEEEIRVAFPTHPQGGARAHGDHPDLDAGAFGEGRQQRVEQPGVPHAGGRREDHRTIGCEANRR